MNSIDLAFAPALEQARLIREKVISPLELVELYLRRIEQLNPELGSFVHVATERAIADATAKTEQLTQTDSEDLPPFFGVPLPIKDLNPVAGMPCAYGIQRLKGELAPADDGIIAPLQQAGFVLLGKTATSELGLLPYTEPDGFPPTRNPWNLNYTPGGSSGGAAAAVAAGLCAIAPGSDGGGSIRGPAFCCGLVGLKPSRGRVSFTPRGDVLNGIPTNGPIGRTVADTAALLDIMAGYVSGDPYWLPDPPISFLEASRQTPRRLKIGYTTTIAPTGPFDPHCTQAVLDTAQRLETLGHDVIEFECPDFSNLIEPFTIVYQAIVSEFRVISGKPAWMLGLPGVALGKMSRWFLRRAEATKSGEYLYAVRRMQMFSRQLVQACNDIDVLLLPTYTHPTIQIGEWASLSPAETLEKIIQWISPCPPFNATGQPAIALPTGFDPNGVPLGVQLIGKPADDVTLISLAAQLEALHPWFHRPDWAIRK